MGKTLAKTGSFAQTFAQRGGSHGLPNVQLAPQIPGAGDTCNSGVNMDPKFGSEELPSIISGAKGEALLGGDSGTNAMKVAEGLAVGCDSPLDVPLAGGDDEEVVG